MHWAQAAMLVLSLLYLIATRGELFVPEEISDSALTNDDSAATKGNDSDEADPFTSATDPEGENESQAGSNENSSSLLDEAGKTQEEPSPTKAEALEQDSQMATGHGEVPVSVQTLKPGQAPKPGVPYWTEVYVDKKMKSVLVNVKTVTIIESINSASKPKYPTTAFSRADPYIKIQMPSVPASSSASKGSKTGKSVPSSSKATTSAKPVSRHTSSTALRKQAKSVTHSFKKQLSTASAKVSSSKSATSTSAKTSRPLPTTTKKEEAGGANSLGSIFNVLKDMPYGGKSSESIYIEGSFSFPKKKALSGKSFKMNGYISTA